MDAEQPENKYVGKNYWTMHDVIDKSFLWQPLLDVSLCANSTPEN